MQIIIKTKNIELTDSLEKFIQSKMAKLNKFFQADAQLLVEIERETSHHRKGEVFFAEAIIVLAGKKLIAQAKGEDMGKKIAKIKEEMEIEIKKHKTKMIETPRRQAKKSHNKEIF